MGVILFGSLAFVAAHAQDAKGERRSFTLGEAVTFAMKNYPAVRAALAQRAQAQGEVSLARTEYLPRLNALWQSNRATRNNISGLLLPQSVIPPITGPVLPVANGQSVWGSATGVLFSWQPFDFGYRRAVVRAAQSSRDRADAESALTQLDVAAASAEAFLGLVAAQQRVAASQADVQRREVFAKSVHVLTTNELRPGVDASRADAELARARIQRIQSEQALAVAQATFAQALGLAGSIPQIEAGGLLATAPSGLSATPEITHHPLLAADQASVDQARSRVRIQERAYVPRFDLQSAAFGRGSGANADGTVAGGANGLGIDRGNWAVGVTVSFPIFDFASIRAKKRIEAAGVERQQARYDQTLQVLTSESQKAQAALDAARQVAAETPMELEAARATETQARTRYQVGLATIVDVAEAQSLLVQAETQDSLARLDIWRGLLQVAVAKGDIEPFLAIVRQSTPGGH
ncbi:MAG: TolC family protein [Acidobacteria bacterium]|nr:TolC family protein [Acidobacteriota bacterium]